jgi:hypothetical protein
VMSVGKVDFKLPGKGNSNFHGARQVHLIIAMTKWIRTRRLASGPYCTPHSSPPPPPLTHCEHSGDVDWLGVGSFRSFRFFELPT